MQLYATKANNENESEAVAMTHVTQQKQYNITAAGAVDREFLVYIEPLGLPQGCPGPSQSCPRV